MKKPVLALIPSAYKTDKVYSVLPVNGDGDFSFYRDSGGTRINENGLIEEITTTNKPRLNWEGNCPSLLMEPQRTNLQIRSEEFDNVAWTKQLLTVNANDTISPDGTKSADKLIPNTVNSTHYIQGNISGLSTSTEATFSVFVKKAEISQLQLLCAQNSSPFTNWARLQFDLNTLTEFGTNVGTYGYEDYNNGWIRVFVTGTPTDVGALIRVTLYKNFSNSFEGNNSDGFYLYGSQIEQGVEPTSYIKTEGSIVTRSEEYRITTSLSGQTQFDKNKGLVFIDVNPFELNTGQSSAISLQDGGYNILLFDFKPNNILNFFINNAPAPGAVSYDYSHSGGRIKAAILWSNGKYRLFANGQLLNSYNTSIEFSQLDSFQFNSYFGTYDFQGKVYGIQVFDELLSDDEIKKMTEL